MKKLIKNTEKKLDSVTTFKDTQCGCYDCFCSCSYSGDKGSAGGPTGSTSVKVRYNSAHTA